MIALLGQLGQPQDYAEGIRLIAHAADNADENAPQGAYVSENYVAHLDTVLIKVAGLWHATSPRITSSQSPGRFLAS